MYNSKQQIILLYNVACVCATKLVDDQDERKYSCGITGKT